jgi:hypothetical protein
MLSWGARPDDPRAVHAKVKTRAERDCRNRPADDGREPSMSEVAVFDMLGNSFIRLVQMNQGAGIETTARPGPFLSA